MPTFSGTTGNDTMDYRTYSNAPPAGWPDTQIWLNLNGLAGNDTIRGSAYNDGIDGGDGADTLYGYAGNDSLTGGAGIDNLYGGDGNDTLHGGTENDNLYGEAGNDWLWGDDGNDYAEGGAGNDTFVGGAGNDRMFGQAGDDIFFGDAGGDVMDGGAGSDRMWGGAGNDQYQFNAQGFDVINDGVTDTGSARAETTYDTDLLIVSYTDADWNLDRVGDNLRIFSQADAADGTLSSSVVIENFFLGGHYVVENLAVANGTGPIYDLTSLLAA
ncbi:calcium-binding protein [Rhizobium sp. SG570]|uniref:calcium-binding protein n=1 Tax=Rhizobium sp. SG570 TaxID=2587113 RepID=UPI00144652C9|nr:calcium-binding protein [Rhizobium sp. SG570]NKJ38683.1 Ca2+-binding RTX toxin-like protein [Rhizobium sp. SG570]